MSVAMLREGARLITDANWADNELEGSYTHATDMLAYSVETPSPGNCRNLAFAIVQHAAALSSHETREDAATTLTIYAAKVLRWCDQNKAKEVGQ